MEKGVLEMYRRSMELHNIFYDPFIGEGDSSAYQSVVKEAIYGPWKTVRKEERNALIMLQKERILGFA